MRHGKVKIEGDLTLDTGATADEISTDGTLAGDSDTAVPTEKAVKTYVDANAGGASYKTGNFTRDTSLATGTQAVTGLGFQPTAVIFFSLQISTREASWGFDDGTSPLTLADDQLSSGTYEIVFRSIYLEETSGSANYEGLVQSFDSDGFTMSWTKTGSPTGTAQILYMAFG